MMVWLSWTRDTSVHMTPGMSSSLFTELSTRRAKQGTNSAEKSVSFLQALSSSNAAAGHRGSGSRCTVGGGASSGTVSITLTGAASTTVAAASSSDAISRRPRGDFIAFFFFLSLFLSLLNLCGPFDHFGPNAMRSPTTSFASLPSEPRADEGSLRVQLRVGDRDARAPF
jgi:hypothetical protein